MPIIDQDFTGVPFGSLLPEGDYLFSVSKMDLMPAKDAEKYPYIQAEFVVTEAENPAVVGWRLWEVFSLKPIMLPRLNAFVRDLGVERDANGRFFTEDCIGKTFRGRVGHKMDDSGQYKDQPRARLLSFRKVE